MTQSKEDIARQFNSARRAFKDACAAINYFHLLSDLDRALLAAENLRASFQALEEILLADSDIKKRMDYHYRYSRALKTLSSMESEPNKSRLLRESFSLLELIRQSRIYLPEQFTGEIKGSTAAFINAVAQDMFEAGLYYLASEWARSSIEIYEHDGESPEPEGIAIGRLSSHLTMVRSLMRMHSAELSSAVPAALAFCLRVEHGYCFSIAAQRLILQIRECLQAG